MSGQELAVAQGLQASGQLGAAGQGLASMGGAQGLQQAGLQAGGMGFQAPQSLGLQMPPSDVGASSMRDLAMGGSNIPASLASNTPAGPSPWDRLANNPQAMQGLLSMGQQERPQQQPMMPQMLRQPIPAGQIPQVGSFNPYMVRAMMGRG